MIIESHYLGSLEYYALLINSESVIINIEEPFQKQTYRNRCYILSANGVQPLIIPLRYSSGMMTKEVTIDYSQRWLKDHWGAFYSAYGKAPFFEYFSEDFRAIWFKKHNYLIDVNNEFLQLSLKLLQVNVNLTVTGDSKKEIELDFTNQIIPKESYQERKIYRSHPYTQLFGDTFVPNLSIMDLIMCAGPQSKEILTASFLQP